MRVLKRNGLNKRSSPRVHPVVRAGEPEAAQHDDDGPPRPARGRERHRRQREPDLRGAVRPPLRLDGLGQPDLQAGRSASSRRTRVSTRSRPTRTASARGRSTSSRPPARGRSRLPGDRPDHSARTRVAFSFTRGRSGTTRSRAATPADRSRSTSPSTGWGSTACSRTSRTRPSAAREIFRGL